jgi:endonuclease I
MADITAWQVEAEVAIPEDVQPHQLAYQRDKATVMRWHKPDPADPWTSFLDSALAKRQGLG